MLQFEEFDASELSCANYFVLFSRGDRRFVAIPIFPSRMFRHSAIYVNTAAGIEAPGDLKGKRVGCPEYAMTAAVWVRGFLQHDYGVLPADITWVLGGLEQPGRRDRIAPASPPGVRLEPAPAGRSLVELLEAGEIDAVVTPSMPSSLRAGSPRVGRLFPDFQQVEAEYFRRTGVFPIMHTVVLRRDLYERSPWAAVSLYKAFCQARDLAFERLYEPDALAVSLAWAIAYVEQELALRGQDLWPYGFEANRATLEALKSHLGEQGLLAADFALEQAFAPSTLSPSLL
jgi:4,5-dihydroxyphthalate decarboxylase